MPIDTLGSVPLEAVKMEQDPLKKFIMYIGYLNSVYKNSTLVEVNTEKLEKEEMDLYKNFVTYLKSLNVDNCDSQKIHDDLHKIVKESNGCHEAVFVNWMNNKLQPFGSLKSGLRTWDGDDKLIGVKVFVEGTLKDMDPENMF